MRPDPSRIIELASAFYGSCVLFTASERSGVRQVSGEPVYFCCESCAQHFEKNQERVVAARKMKL